MFTYGFYNYSEDDAADDKKEYDAVQLSQMFDGIISDGIISGYGGAFQVTISDTLASMVIVKSGRAWFNHTWNYNNTDLQVDLPEAPTTNNRQDALVIDINNTTRHNEITWVLGEESVARPRPVLVNADSHHQVPLAYVMRNRNQSTISASSIEDARGVSIPNLGVLCPFLKPVTEIFTVDTIITQWLNEMTDWEDDKKAEFTSWFANLRAMIDSSTATNLQNQIDELIRGTVEETVTLSKSSDTIVDFHSSYMMNYSYFDVAAEITQDLPYVSYRKIEAFPSASDPFVRVTFSRYTGPLTTPPTFKARLYMR